MTVKEFIAELEYWKREAAGFKHQMEVNLDYCKHYESALTVIVKICGHEVSASCQGYPEGIDETALRLVTKLTEKPQEKSHAGDCTIYRPISNGSPTDGICTCGHGLTFMRAGDWSQMYSEERAKGAN